MIVGNTIAVGILRTPGDIAAHLPSVPWFLGVWVVGGVYALLGALTLAELGAMIPQSGGQYVFARRSFGEYAGFLVGWSDWISSCGAVALSAMTMGEYSDVLIPGLKGKATAVGITVTLALTAVQVAGLRASDLTQQVTSLIKTIVLLGLAGVCLVAAPAQPEAASAPTTTFVPVFGALVLSLQAVIYTYDGWNGMLYFGGEVKNPGRDIPRSMANGVLAVIAIYLLLNIAFLHVLPPERMAGEKLVAAAVAQELFGPRGDTVVRAIILISMLSAANAILLIASRVPYAMSRDGLMWHRLGDVNVGGTPSPSLIASAACVVLLLITGTFGQTLALAAFFYVVNYTVSFLSVFALRRREPETPRPYRALGYPYVTGFLVLGSCGFLASSFISDQRNSLVSLGILVASYPVFRVIRILHRRRTTTVSP